MGAVLMQTALGAAVILVVCYPIYKMIVGDWAQLRVLLLTMLITAFLIFASWLVGSTAWSLSQEWAHRNDDPVPSCAPVGPCNLPTP